jgi:hypothetical protein
MPAARANVGEFEVEEVVRRCDPRVGLPRLALAVGVADDVVPAVVAAARGGGVLADALEQRGTSSGGAVLVEAQHAIEEERERVIGEMLDRAFEGEAAVDVAPHAESRADGLAVEGGVHRVGMRWWRVVRDSVVRRRVSCVARSSVIRSQRIGREIEADLQPHGGSSGLCSAQTQVSARGRAAKPRPRDEAWKRFRGSGAWHAPAVGDRAEEQVSTKRGRARLGGRSGPPPRRSRS